MDAAEILGPTPIPQLLRDAELPLPAAFPPKAHRHSMLDCSAGGGRNTTSKQRLPAVPYLCRLLDQKDYAGGAAFALPGERKRRLEAGTGGPGSSKQNTRAIPQILQYCGNIDA